MVGAVEDAVEEEPAITTVTIAEVTMDIATIATVTTVVIAAGAEAVVWGTTILKGPIIDLRMMISMQEIDTITENFTG